ncbi:gasdermin-A-like [Hemitrygon akajei]|uniref:gasdermin-A-like n=1 Tax=Hemitrygon akajei TaxID=2704970 RepID=UPI003BF95ABA
MFKKAVQQLLNQIDSGGDLIPATSVYDSEKFKPLCLVCRRMGGPFWRKAKYSCTEFKLKQILIDDDSLPTAQQNDLSFQFSESLDVKGYALVNNNPHIANKMRETIVLKGIKQVYVDVPELVQSLETRKVGRSWEFVKKNYSGRLCVVTETLICVQPITLKKANKKELGLNMTLFDIVPAGAEYHYAAESTQCIPEGSVLAFKVWDLTVTKDGTLCLSNPKKQSQTESWMSTDSTEVGGIEEFGICGELQCLDDGLKQHLLDLVCQIIEDSELLSILSDVLSDACAGMDYNLSELNQLEEGRRELGENLLTIWSEEQLKNATEDQLVKAVSFLLAALEDLSPATLQLLMKSLKMQILSQQFTLLTTIFNDIEHGQVDQVLKVGTENFTEDAFGTTAEILNEIGLHLERDRVEKKRELSLYELSIALCCLNALSSH